MMGLCTSKDYTSVRYTPNGDAEIQHHLPNVKPGEDVTPRVRRLEHKLEKELGKRGSWLGGGTESLQYHGAFTQRS